MNDDQALPSIGHLLGRIYRGTWDIARHLPGGESAERQARKIEKALIDEVAKPTELERAEPPREPLRAAMANLLNRSVTDSKDTAREYYFALIMRQLLPDEARVIAALSDGTAYPLIHLTTRTPRSTHYLLQNASTVGRAAGVVQPALTPFYVTRLINFGLADVGDEAPALNTQYELLQTDDRIRKLEGTSRLGPRVIRLSLHISELGLQFWAASDPSARGVGA